MNDLDYIKKCFIFDFNQANSFCMELYNQLEKATKELINIDKKYKYLKRGIVYNSFRALKNIMITNVNNIKFYENQEKIVVNFEYFSLNSGITTAKKIIDLELAY